MEEKTLHEISVEAKTDKALYHNFCDFYEKFFNNIRHKPISLLEIGVFNGASLIAWENYFELAQIYAIDIFDMSHFDRTRIKTCI